MWRPATDRRLYISQKKGRECMLSLLLLQRPWPGWESEKSIDWWSQENCGRKTQQNLQYLSLLHFLYCWFFLLYLCQCLIGFFDRRSLGIYFDVASRKSTTSQKYFVIGFSFVCLISPVIQWFSSLVSAGFSSSTGMYLWLQRCSKDNMLMYQVVNPQLKHFSNWMDCHEILYSHGPEK